MEPTQEPPGVADEMTQLMGYLNQQRDIIRAKVDGLNVDQLAQKLPPSEMTLGGMVLHLAVCEDSWFGECVAGAPMSQPWASAPWEDDWDWEWHIATGQSLSEILALYEENVQRADAALAGRSPDDPTVRARRSGEALNVRWVLLHMIEEYARHAGHADLLRESIDGQTG